MTVVFALMQNILASGYFIDPHPAMHTMDVGTEYNTMQVLRYGSFCFSRHLRKSSEATVRSEVLLIRSLSRKSGVFLIADDGGSGNSFLAFKLRALHPLLQHLYNKEAQANEEDIVPLLIGALPAVPGGEVGSPHTTFIGTAIQEMVAVPVAVGSGGSLPIFLCRGESLSSLHSATPLQTGDLLLLASPTLVAIPGHMDVIQEKVKAKTEKLDGRRSWGDLNTLTHAIVLALNATSMVSMIAVCVDEIREGDDDAQSGVPISPFPHPRKGGASASVSPHALKELLSTTWQGEVEIQRTCSLV